MKRALIVDATAAAHIGWEQVRVRDLMATLPAAAGQDLPAGEGTKGPRLSAWARVRTASIGEPDWARWFVARRDSDDTLTYYRVGAPAETTLAESAHAAGTRWSIETGCAAMKGEVGLDQYEVRSWHGGHRHVTLAMLAHAFLTVMRTWSQDQDAGRPTTRAKGGFLRCRRAA